MDDDRVRFSIKADVYPRTHGQWYGLHGWGGAKPDVGLKELEGVKDVRPDDDVAPEPKPAPAVQARGQKRPWDAVEESLFPDPNGRRGGDAISAFQPRVQVCRATDAFKAATLPSKHIKQDLARDYRPKWIFDKDYGMAAAVPRGGPPVWVVAKRVAETLHKRKRS